MNIKTKSLGDGKNLYFIENKNMKTIIVWIMFYMPHDNKASLNSLLPRVLLSGSNSFKDSKDITRFLYKNYGASFGYDINLKGGVYTLGFYGSFINHRLTGKGEEIFKNMMGFIEDILYNPSIHEGRFDEDIFEIEKENLIAQIKGKADNKDSYAFDRCVEITCKGEEYEADKLGKLDWAMKITNEQLKRRYDEIINSMPFNIYVMGDMDFNESISKVQGLIRKSHTSKLALYNEGYPYENVNRVIEKMDIYQDKVCISFRTEIDLKHENFLSLIVFNKMFGGGPESRLFKNIREEKGLCYNIFSTLEKYKGIIFAACGTEAGKGQEVSEYIIDIFNDLKSGKFGIDELKAAISMCVKDYEDIKDDNYAYISFMQGLNIYETDYDLDELIERLGSVNKEDILRCMEAIKLNTVYILQGR